MAERTTIGFDDRPITVQAPGLTFKVVAPGRFVKTAVNGAPPLKYQGGMEGRFHFVRGIVEDLLKNNGFLTKAPHQFLKPAAVMAICAVETGPHAQGGPKEKGMLFISTENTATYNPRAVSVDNALNIPQVTMTTGQGNNVKIKDYWNYAESIRGSIAYFNDCLHYVNIPGNRDATLLTAAMGYTAGYGRKNSPVTFWEVGPNTREYAGLYSQAFNQLVTHYYIPETPTIDYTKFVTDYGLKVE